MTRTPWVITSLLILLMCSASLRAKPAVRKATVYPPPHPGIAFDHRTHRGSQCNECHGKVEESTRTGDTHSPPHGSVRHMPRCFKNHAPFRRAAHAMWPIPQPLISRSSSLPNGERCDASAPMVLRRAQARLHFSHKAHALKGLGCTSCHGAPGSLATPLMPSMAECTSCHTASNTAAVSSLLKLPHHADAHPWSPRSCALPPKTGTPPTMAPQDHTVDWVARHGVIAKASATACILLSHPALLRSVSRRLGRQHA